MYNLRNELIKSIINSLKIDNNPFNTITIQELISEISDSNLQKFYQGLFGAEHSYLNGIDRVAKVAEQFKPQQIDLSEIKAKELINIVESINTKIGEDATRMGEDFVKLVENVKLPGLSEDDKAILDNVKPYSDHKQLILNIRSYQTSVDALKAFKRAIEYPTSLSAIGYTVMKSLKGNK